MTSLPTLNAALNALSAALLLAGYAAIRRRRILLHLRLMAAALASSSAFLVSYLVYHHHVGSVAYRGPGRPAYLALLLTHTVLAALVPPLALRLLWLARKAWPGGDFSAHARLGRVLLPIWLYVSVTGVVVYWLLYVRVGAAPAAPI
ncbi:MAG: DUF420 domain-containing protein [Elusimicrobia bacterium]|nr:DUF420 domain-containing protein [Elusimicrobiota bacterium]